MPSGIWARSPGGHASRGTRLPPALCLWPRVKLAVQATRTSAETVGFDLTEREHEVLELMVKGLNNNEIALTLVISRSTAKFQVSSILSKLGVASRTEAVDIALLNGLV